LQHAVSPAPFCASNDAKEKEDQLMFETSVIREGVAGSRRRASLLSISVIAHTLVIVASITAGIASVKFPAQPPDEYELAPIPVAVPLPPTPQGNPNGGGRPQQAVPKPQTPPPSNQLTAPSTVPDTIQPVESSSGEQTDPSGTGTGQVAGPVGDPNGVPGSISTDTSAPIPAVPEVVEDRIYQASEVKAPVLIHRVEPRYPTTMIHAGMPATVGVRCIIDKNGNVRDAQVVVASLPPFNNAVIEAVKQWRFTPGSLRGQAVNTYLDLTVNFAVKRR
jgi:protein TonB